VGRPFARATNGARERVLTDQELAQVWRACGDNDFGRIVKLLLLTGQRKAEIGELRWTEVDIGEAGCRASAFKNGRPMPCRFLPRRWASIKTVPRAGLDPDELEMPFHNLHPHCLRQPVPSMTWLASWMMAGTP
jgi:integrase